MINSFLKERSNHLQEHGIYRQRLINESMVLQTMVNFSSNDYLALTEEPAIKQAYQKGFANYPTGSGGSMVICGYHPIHQQFEHAFSEALGVDDCLLFSSGYSANLAIISLLAKFKGSILIDKKIHASFYDGLKMATVKPLRFLHNDLEHLEQQLKKNDCSVIITESIFSMSGEAAALKDISALSFKYKVPLVVDEAHAFGIIGSQGMGAISQYQLTQNDVPLRIIPLGKAFACQGAVVAGKREWIDALLQAARSHIYSTAMSPALTYGLVETLAFIQQAGEKREKLQQLIQYFKNLIADSPLIWRKSSTAIQQLQLNCPFKALNYARSLSQRGVFCQALRQPTVSKQETGLRIILNVAHDFKDLDNLLSALHQIYETTS